MKQESLGITAVNHRGVLLLNDAHKDCIAEVGKVTLLRSLESIENRQG